MRKLLIIIGLALLSSCAAERENKNMNEIAENYVKLVLHVGQYDAAVVDAYHGPEEWIPVDLTEEQKSNFPRNEMFIAADNLINDLNAIDETGFTELEKMRNNFLHKQLIAIRAKIEMIGGEKYKFDEESKLLYDAVATHYKQEHFSEILAELDKLLPGKGDVSERYNEYRIQFIIPSDLVDTVFQTAINEGRRRTLKKIDLPEGENFIVEYVKDQPWGAYNWFKGNSFSLIQVNLDLPIYIDRAIDLACHEGYPGHHVYSSLMEQNLLKKNNFIEYSIYPLFSPTSLIAEGTANYGIKVAFPGEERINYEKEVLFPLAGLNPDEADKYYEILNLIEKLNYARNEASRKYYDGEFDKEQMKDWLVKYCLYTPERAEQSISFIDTYGSYIINYNYGQTLCAEYIEAKGGTADNPDKRWELFEELISHPYTPSDLLK